MKEKLLLLNIFFGFVFLSGIPLYSQELQLSIQMGHLDEVWDTSISENGRYIASTSNDKSIKIWDVFSGFLIKTFSNNTTPFTSIDFSPMNGCIYGCDFFGDYSIFSFKKNFDSFNESKMSDITSLFFFKNESLLYSDSYGMLTFIDFDNNIQFEKHVCDGDILSITTYDNNKEIWIASSDNKVRKLNPQLEILQEFNIPIDDIKKCAFSNKKNYLVTTNSYGKVSLISIFEQKRIAEYNISYGTTISFDFSHDDKFLLLKVGKNLYNIFALPKLNNIFGSQYIYAASFANDTNLLAHFNPEGYVEIINIDDFSSIAQIACENALCTTLSSKGLFLVCGDRKGSLIMSDVYQKTEIKHLKGINQIKKNVFFHSKNNSIIIIYENGDIVNWSMKYGKIDYSSNLGINNISDVHLSKDDSFLYVIMDNLIRIFNVDNLKQIASIKGDGEIVSFNLSSNGKYLVFSQKDKYIKVYRTKDYSLISTIKSTYAVKVINVSDDGEKIYTGTSKSLRILKTSDGKLIKSIYNSNDIIQSICELKENDLILYIFSDKTLYTLDKNFKKGKYDDPSELTISSSIDEEMNFPLELGNNNKLLAHAGENWSILVRNTVDLSIIHRLSGHGNYVVDIDFSSDGTKLISSSTDGSIIIWDLLSGEEIVTLIIDKDRYIAVTNNNYYSNSKNSYNLVCFQFENSTYSFEQFDIKYNRPDIIIKRLGCASNDLIDSYSFAYQKRVAKMKIDLKQLGNSISLPQIFIKNQDSIKIKTKNPLCIVDIKAIDNKTPIDRINIWINNVPIYGRNGIRVNKKEVFSYSDQLNLSLSKGNNKIQLSCLNKYGIESLKETFQVTYESDEAQKSDLYLIALSVSEYQNKSMNLKYAVKDGRDLTSLLSKSKNYKNIYIDTLFDQEATKENIKKIKEKLFNSKVDDQVILFVSGHGLLDNNYDFYFATHDIDFDNPAERGISYDQLEWLLDSIPARKKLFMMDACHSGEVDKEELVALNELKEEEGLKAGIKTYSYRAKILQGDKESGIGLQNSFELMQELFTNLNRGSGAVVISAAAGDSYALESDEWNNGVFTYSVLDGIKNEHADLNNDGEITVSELRDYVSEKVQEETGGRQKPTARQENVEFDFRVW